MKKVGLLIGVISLGLNLAAFAAEKPANAQGRPQAGRREGVRERAQDLTPEERAKMREKWQNMSEEERIKYRAEMREKLGGERPSPEAVQQQRTLADQIAAMKQEHQTAIGELQAIKQLALKEKAKETAAALEKLIARHEQEHQKRLASLQQRLQKAEALRKVPGDAPSKPAKPGDKSAVSEEAKAKQKRERSKQQ